MGALGEEALQAGGGLAAAGAERVGAADAETNEALGPGAGLQRGLQRGAVRMGGGVRGRRVRGRGRPARQGRRRTAAQPRAWRRRRTAATPPSAPRPAAASGSAPGRGTGLGSAEKLRSR